MANFKRGQIQIQGGDPILSIGRGNCRGAGGANQSREEGESTPGPPEIYSGQCIQFGVHMVHVVINLQHAHFFFTQRWARAYRDNHYHVAVNTNNGVEAQNKLFKYKFLLRTKQKATLSSTMTILVEKYLPTCKQKYLFQN